MSGGGLIMLLYVEISYLKYLYLYIAGLKNYQLDNIFVI